MARMNGTRVSIVVFATSFLLGESYNRPLSFSTSDPRSQPRAPVHALDSGLVNLVETTGRRRTVADVRDVLLCYLQSTDRIPLLFCFRGHWWWSNDTLVSP